MRRNGWFHTGGSVSKTPTFLTVVINEVAWMGTEAAARDEWIELYNNTTSTIDITGWHLIAADGSPDITFRKRILGRQ